MQILRLQVAVFFKSPAERPDLLSGNMPQELISLFDLIPAVNPIASIPQGMQNIPDFPIVTLQSSTPGYQGTIAKNRADLFYNYTTTRNYSELLAEFSHYADLFVKYFSSKQHVNRIGIVISAFIPEENAVKAIAKKYANRELQNSEELSVRFNKREQLSGIRLNNIINLRSDQISFEKQSPIPGVIVECDINNIPLPTQLTDEQCKNIFDFAFSRYTAEEVKKLVL